jgi:alcohol dehydrogenase (cytochrome c)
MRTRQWMWAGLAAASALWPAFGGAAEIGNYSPVTADRLANPEPGNWILYRRTYDGQGFSPLDKINTTNVKNLEPAWTLSTGVNEGHEAPPIVNNGVMFVATPQNQVIALDAKTGDEIWRYKREMPEDSHSCTRRAVVSGSGRTSSTSPLPMITWWRSTPRPARWPGTRRYKITRRVST